MRRNSSRASLRPARPEDGDAVVALCAALSRHEGGPQPALTAAAFRRDGFGPGAAFDCLIGETAGRPVGYAMYLADYDTDLLCHGTYLADLYVDITARRCGIGRALMAALAHITRRRGGQWLRWNVLRSNPSARAFYRSLGQELPDLINCSTDGAAFGRLAAVAAAAGVVIRKAAAGDVASLGGLLEELLASEGVERPAPDLAARLLADGFGARRAFAGHMAERDGKAIGYAVHWLVYDTEPATRGVYLSDVYVRPEERRSGIARALMGAVARDRHADGATYLEWEVRRDNAGARAFYATVGQEYPDVLPMLAAGDQFATLAAQSVDLG